MLTLKALEQVYPSCNIVELICADLLKFNKSNIRYMSYRISCNIGYNLSIILEILKILDIYVISNFLNARSQLSHIRCKNQKKYFC